MGGKPVRNGAKRTHGWETRQERRETDPTDSGAMAGEVRRWLGRDGGDHLICSR